MLTRPPYGYPFSQAACQRGQDVPDPDASVRPVANSATVSQQRQLLLLLARRDPPPGCAPPLGSAFATDSAAHTRKELNQAGSSFPR